MNFIGVLQHILQHILQPLGSTVRTTCHTMPELPTPHAATHTQHARF